MRPKSSCKRLAQRQRHNLVQAAFVIFNFTVNLAINYLLERDFFPRVHILTVVESDRPKPRDSLLAKRGWAELPRQEDVTKTRQCWIARSLLRPSTTKHALRSLWWETCHGWKPWYSPFHRGGLTPSHREEEIMSRHSMTNNDERFLVAGRGDRDVDPNTVFSHRWLSAGSSS
jgi:hypothetical protein